MSELPVWMQEPGMQPQGVVPEGPPGVPQGLPGGEPVPDNEGNQVPM